MNRLKQCREQSGLSQKEVAVSLGVKPPSVSNWESGRTNPSSRNLQMLAKLYHVNMEYLTGEMEDKGIDVPVLGRIPAGIPIEAIQDIIDWEEIPKEWAKGDKQYFALKVRGDSMSPEYLDGDIIILQRASDCDSGKDCAVMVDGNDATFKRIRKKGQTLILQPLNHSYDPFIYTAEEVKKLPVTILGFVVEQRRKR